MRFAELPRFLFRLVRMPPRLVYRIGLGPILGRLVLLLTTRGRKTGLRHVTPLQYEEEHGIYYVGSARGVKADWYRNVLVDPRVTVQVGKRCFHGAAVPITDAGDVLDFLQLRLQRHPRMIGAILRAQGAGRKPDRDWLEKYAGDLTVVAIYPEGHRKAQPADEAVNAADHPHDGSGSVQ